MTQTEKLALSSYFPATALVIPRGLRVKERTLVWNTSAHNYRGVTPTDQTLTQFIDLAEGDPRTILSYARTWGVLGVCRHNVPVPHERVPLITEEPCSSVTGAEPLAVWQAYARKVAAILKVSKLLKQNRVGSREDWEHVQLFFAVTVSAEAFGNVIQERLILGEIMTYFLKMASIYPTIFWADSNLPQIWFRYHGLLGVIFMKLMIAIAQQEFVYLCSECGEPYSPSIRPKRSQRNYCFKCREDGAPARYAAEQYRNRQRV